MKARRQAMSDVRDSRERFERTLSALRARMAPAELADDAIHLIDPDLNLLGRMAYGIRHNKLVSLAVLAGVGWLAGTSRRRNGRSRQSRAATTAPPSNFNKEKTDDSGKSNRDEWPISDGFLEDQIFAQDVDPQGRSAASR